MIKSQEEWNELHKCCPKCGSSSMQITLMSQISLKEEFGDDFNKASCQHCSWDGKVNELVKERL